MLMTIRDKAQGWIAWAIVILISIPFALWGIQEYLGVGSEPVIAQVNDREITEREVENAAFRLRNELREQLGAQYNAELFEEAMLRKQVLDGMIRDTLIQQSATDLGLRAGDFMLQQTIMGIPAFQVGGQFDTEVYKRSVKLQGLSETAFEEKLRNNLISRQLELAIQGSSFRTSSRAREAEELGNQTRKIAYITLSTNDFKQTAVPSEAEIKAYYDKHAADFMTEERVKLEYLLLNLDTIAKTLKVSDEEVRAYYEEHKAEFVVADKKRVSHILFEIDDAASDENANQVMAQAEAAYKRIDQGENFSDVAKEVSQDISTASAGGDLGYIEPGIFDKAFEAAVSELQLNAVSKPVRTRFGYHLITVTELVKGDADDFDAVKAEVAEGYLKGEAEQIFFDYAERLGNLSYETPDYLEPATAELNIPLQKSDWIPRMGGEGQFASAKDLGAAFSEEAITQGYNSEPLELSPTELMVLRVIEHQVSSLKPLTEVKAAIIDALNNESAFASLEKQAAEILSALGEGQSLSSIAESQQLTLSEPGYVARVSSTLPEQVVKTAFEMPRQEAGQKSYAKTVVSEQEIAVLVLEDVKDGESESPQQLMMMLANQQGSEEFELYIESLRKKADIQYFSKD